ncbi:MAG: 5-oxoprolinase [Balneolaceae bacterium]|nr:MAG: 5-oxoprolinase [Balneolaceae bacterium]
MKKRNKSWNFCIDTGGTFTDCLAIGPAGKTHRCKVLSSSSIRGSVEAIKGNRIRIKTVDSFPDSFFDGYTFRLPGWPETDFIITASNGKNSEISVDGFLPEVSPGTLFEIQSPEEAPLLAIRMVTKTPLYASLPPLQLRLSTTKGTNALLERRGGITLFFITEGFKDLLSIKNQRRPELFSINIKKPDPFYSQIIEIPERLDANGNILKKPDWDLIRQQIEPLVKDAEAAAICLMHSYRNPGHEIKLESILHDLGVPYVSRSSKLNQAIKIVPRAITTDVDAYLTPVMQRYLTRISQTIGETSLRIMSSAGSLIEAGHYSPKDGLFSGPAGGVIGAAAAAQRVSPGNLQSFSREQSQYDRKQDVLNSKLESFHKIISFDMGGTSTDVARYDGGIDYIFEHTVGDATLAAPAIAIETVAAGGGSVCGFDGQSLTVGPESAGADPGPACYGRGGPLTITDINLLSGRLHPSNFTITINTEAAEIAFERIMESVNINRGEPLPKEDLLRGFIDIANERMAQAIRKISIQKGFDPAGYTLVAFGGAGAQHALAVAEKLKISRVLVPADAGLLSAYGLMQAKLEQIVSRQVLQTLDKAAAGLQSLFRELSNEAITGLQNQGVDKNRIVISRKILHLRLLGQDSSLEIEWKKGVSIAKSFKKSYIEQYGHWIEGRPVEIETIRVIASENILHNEISDPANDRKMDPKSEYGFETEIPPFSDKAKTDSNFSWPAYRIGNLPPGTKLRGPAVILDLHSTTVIEPGWKGELTNDGSWLIQKLRGFSKSNTGGLVREARPEAVQLQLYTNRFRSVADQMGEILQKTALSVNVKERLDYSCALLDADGYLVVNAPHIPVHLGAMGTCVRTLIQYFKKDHNNHGFQNPNHLNEGDVLITNHPGFGGSHLPDITVITPVFYDGKRIAFVASRAHHAEIGGKRPGSMPPDAKNLAEEGVVIPPLFLAHQGKFEWDRVEKLLQSSPWPSRSVDENMADIRAAVAANHRGLFEIKKLAEAFGTGEVTRYMNRLKSYAAGRMKNTLEKIPDGVYRAEEKLDDGSLIIAACTVQNRSLTINFTGTSGVHPGNLNANPSIVNSVIMYVLRLLVDEPLPLNDGLLEPVEVILPKGMLNPVFSDNPGECPAVVGGNIETSQRLTDTLLKAFSRAACSYGTMNNVLFGNTGFGYYETVGGGTGAGDGFHGTDAIHQHMTNTRATDPEILEYRYPVRLDRYEVRQGSGGLGKWKGGNGIIREMTFLEPVSLSVLTQHRIVPPYGLNGGEPGITGEQWIEKNGKKIKLYWKDGADLEAGDRFILHTPGGGGYGSKDSEN